MHSDFFNGIIIYLTQKTNISFSIFINKYIKKNIVCE